MKLFSRLFFVITGLYVPIQKSAAQTDQSQNILFIFDASGSMSVKVTEKGMVEKIIEY
ncbi:MAG: hypothetical protein ACXWCG_07085 [Flavitalea sp.]